MSSLRESALLAAGYLRAQCQEQLRLSCPHCGTERIGREPLDLANGWQCATCSGWSPAPRAVCFRCREAVHSGLDGSERDCESPSAYRRDRAFCAFAPEERIWLWKAAEGSGLHASAEGNLLARFSSGELYADTLVCEPGTDAMVAAGMVPLFAGVARQKPVLPVGEVTPPVLPASPRRRGAPATGTARDDVWGAYRRGALELAAAGTEFASRIRKATGDVALPAVTAAMASARVAVTAAMASARVVRPSRLSECLAVAALGLGVVSLLSFPVFGIMGGVAAIAMAFVAARGLPEGSSGQRGRKWAKVGLWSGVASTGLQLATLAALPLLSAWALAPSPLVKEVDASIAREAWTEARKLAADSAKEGERNDLLDKISAAEAQHLMKGGDMEGATRIATGISNEYQREDAQDKIALARFEQSWKASDLDSAARIAAGINSEFRREEAQDKIAQLRLDKIWVAGDLEAAARVAALIHSEYRREEAQDKITSRLATEALEKGDLPLAAKEAARIHSEYKRNSMLKRIKGAK